MTGNHPRPSAKNHHAKIPPFTKSPLSLVYSLGPRRGEEWRGEEITLAILYDFLPSIAQRSFPVALTAPSSSSQWHDSGLVNDQLSAAMKGVVLVHEGVSSIQQTLIIDFAECDAATDGLDDDDANAVLACAMAMGYAIKRLRLGCVGITGRGLELLRGSTSLEQLDLAQVPEISLEGLLPILQSIGDAEGNTLRQLLLHWFVSMPLILTLAFGAVPSVCS